MKINLINEDQLQIIITKKDMFGKDMRALFRDIIEQAKFQFGFEVVQNTSLMVEAYPLSDESMILTITKVNSSVLNLNLFAPDMTSIQEEPWGVFEFKSLDDLINLAHEIKIPEDCESIVYKYDNHYQLYLQDVNQVVESSRGHFVEFGEISQLSKDYLDEHGELFIKEQALDVLYQL